MRIALLLTAMASLLASCGGEDDPPLYTLTMDCVDGRQLEWAPERWWTDGADKHTLAAGQETPPDGVLDDCGGV